MGQRLDVTGQRFGRLLAIKRVSDYVSKQGLRISQWKCICDCGNETIVRIERLGSGHTRSCGCLARQKLPDNRARFNRLVDSLTWNAAKRNYVYALDSLTVSGIVTQPCRYCGKEAEPFNGLDRVDNAQGYVENNVVSCCRMCNVAKNNHSVDDFKAWIERAYHHLKGE